MTRLNRRQVLRGATAGLTASQLGAAAWAMAQGLSEKGSAPLRQLPHSGNNESPRKGLTPFRTGSQAAEPAPNRARLNDAARRALERGYAYLRERQSASGLFGTDPHASPAITAFGGMALLASGSVPGRGPHGGAIEAAVSYLLEQMEPSGYIQVATSTSRGPMYGHGFATLFLAECHGMSRHPQLRDGLQRAVSVIVAAQNREGGWRYLPRREDADLSVTACQLIALKAAHNAGLAVPPTTVDAAVSYLKQLQNPDGGFAYTTGSQRESSFPRSAAALSALYAAGLHQDPAIARGLKYLMQFPPSARSQAREVAYFLYGQYYAAQALWQAGGEFWQTWYPAIRDYLVHEQRSIDGSWIDPQGAEYATALACLILQMPANHLPIFTR